MSHEDGWKLLENKVKSTVLSRIKTANILTLWSCLTNYFISLGMLKVFKIAEDMIRDIDNYDKEKK